MDISSLQLIRVIEYFCFPVMAVAAFSFGLFLYFKPQQAFDIQKWFYALINWRIEPISLQKEIRNTRILGIFLIVFVIIACIIKLWDPLR